MLLADITAFSVVMKNNVANMKNCGKIFTWLGGYIIIEYFPDGFIDVDFFSCSNVMTNKYIYNSFIYKGLRKCGLF